MIRVELATIALLPPFSKVTLCTDLDDWVPLEGAYFTDRWRFDLAFDRYSQGFDCKFVLNGGNWNEGPNLQVPHGPDDSTYTFHLNRNAEQPVRFGPPLGPSVDIGPIHTRLFDVIYSQPADPVYDVIVIGSGMAGGVLADRLADSGVRTLLLEAGGVPLETHIANLPRPQNPGDIQVHKHVWARWDEFRAVNYDAPPPQEPGANVYNGGQAFNLGGRSVFWGGFIPRMSSWELDYWPRQLKWDLEDRYYQLAEDVMGRSTAPLTHYTRSVHRMLREFLPAYSHFDAPVAVRQNLAGANMITTGLFSTADLLLESVRTRGRSGSDYLTVRTHQLAINVAPGDPCVVTTRDIASERENQFRGRIAVLSCGCLESARLANRSDLGNGLVGQGVTDHPIAFTHFAIPADSPFYDRYGNVKTVSQPTEPREGEDRRRWPFNILLELGADFNQGRFLDEDIFEDAASKRSMICEIVFLNNAELHLPNSVNFDETRDFRPVTRIRNPGIADDVKAEIRRITDAVLNRLQGERLGGNEGDGGLGVVAHEVGSLRMAVTDSNNVTKGLQAALDGVVDSDGRFRDHPQVYACDLSIFPTSPAANPSLTAVALALRLADRLAVELDAQRSPEP